MKLVKYLLGGLAMLGLISSPAFADLNDIINKGSISIAVPQDFAPFGSAGADLKPEGYDVDVAKLIAKDLGVELNLVPVTSANRIPYLQTNKVDIVISSMGANPGRAKSIWFSSAYAPFFSGAFAADNVSASSTADFSGKTIAVTRGTLEDLAITESSPSDADIKRFEDNAVTIAAYLAGQADVLVTGNVIAAKIKEDNPEVNLETKFIINNSPCFMGVAKGNVDLLRWINVFILHKRLGGQLNEISEKWFGQQLPDALPTL